jgi:hypothetical protein
MVLNELEGQGKGQFRGDSSLGCRHSIWVKVALRGRGDDA